MRRRFDAHEAEARELNRSTSTEPGAKAAAPGQPETDLTIGLSQTEAARRLAAQGPNAIEDKRTRSADQIPLLLLGSHPMALQRLLTDIGEGSIDVVVVYKIDRLTRSLMDFARIVEVFDTNGVSFVSITQAFNTTTSMGRLTLNVLLSFAQFEREVTAERICKLAELYILTGVHRHNSDRDLLSDWTSSVGRAVLCVVARAIPPRSASAQMQAGASCGEGSRMSRGPVTEDHPMTKSKTRNAKHEKRTPSSTRHQGDAAMPARPGGKLGLIVDHLSAKRGATAQELAEATGWQKHSVLGALSRLRARGFGMRLETEGERKAYCLDHAKS